jgi:hypothetical protein
VQEDKQEIQLDASMDD